MSVKPLAVFSAFALKCTSKTELRIGDDGLGFGSSVPGKGPSSAASPTPMAMKRVRPRIAKPEGPEGAGSPPRLLMADGRPSSSVRRSPLLGSRMEIRPVLGPLPCSATSRLPFCDRMILVGALRSEARTVVGHCAFTLTLVRVNIRRTARAINSLI